jgi:hypothetical protein
MPKGDRDVVWDTLEEIFGPVTNPASRGRRNKAVQLIKESILVMAEHEPDRFPRDDEHVKREIRGRYARLVQAWPTIKPTDTFLSSRWDDVQPRPTPRPHSSAPSPDPPFISRENALELLHDWKRRHP